MYTCTYTVSRQVPADEDVCNRKTYNPASVGFVFRCSCLAAHLYSTSGINRIEWIEIHPHWCWKQVVIISALIELSCCCSEAQLSAVCYMYFVCELNKTNICLPSSWPTVTRVYILIPLWYWLFSWQEWIQVYSFLALIIFITTLRFYSFMVLIIFITSLHLYCFLALVIFITSLRFYSFMVLIIFMTSLRFYSFMVLIIFMTRLHLYSFMVLIIFITSLHPYSFLALVIFITSLHLYSFMVLIIFITSLRLYSFWALIIFKTRVYIFIPFLALIIFMTRVYIFIPFLALIIFMTRVCICIALWHRSFSWNGIHSDL